MRKWREYACNCIRGVIVLGMSIQILLGIAWMAVGFLKCQSFYLGMVFILQLAAAGYAAYRFLHAFGMTSEVIWKVSAILTIPMAMQCHMSLRPFSLVSSAILIFLAFLMEKRGKKLRTVIADLLLVVLLMAAGAVISSLCGEEGAVKMPKSPAEAAVSRFVWPYFDKYYVEWPREIQEVISPQEAREISLYSDMVEEYFIPVTQKALGKEGAQSCYWQMVRLSFRYHTREITERILWDALCYSFSPYMLKLQLDGVGYESFSGRNYDIMRQNAPVLTSLYVRYVSWWFLTGLALAVLLKILALPGRKRKAGEDKKRKSGYFLLPVCTGAVMVLLCTFSGAGIMDYKNTVTVTIFWYLWILYETAKNRCITEK